MHTVCKDIRIWLFAVACVSLITGACDSATGDDPCGATTKPGLVVLINDSATATVICDATVLAQEAQYWEVLVPVAAAADGSSTCSYEGAFERPGIYRVEGNYLGYLMASQSGIEVTQGKCNVLGQTVALPLTESP